MKQIAIYMRVSSKSQDTRAQRADLDAFAKCSELPVVVYEDKFTGKTLERPGFTRLMGAARSGEVASIVVWRLDRLGRTAAGLTALFDELQNLRVNLISLKDGLDLSTPAGRLMSNVLASVAQFETEVRRERQAAGIMAAKAAGVRWGGREKGANWKLTAEHVGVIRRMHADGKKVTAIAKILNLSRPTVYKVLEQ